MGGGSYSYLSASSRAHDISDKNIHEIFQAKSLNQKLDIKNKIRECRDTEEHPNTLPIIIALDVTGSMGRIPESLIKGEFAEIMNSIYEAGVEDPQVCFLAIGDVEFDNYPFQAAQFETSDQTLDEWLESICIESGGGGNDYESYILAWYFASRHTDCDAINKRDKKGILITIGDEKVTPELTKSEIESVFGDSIQSNIDYKDLYEEVISNWNTYHISASYNGKNNAFTKTWNFMEDHHIVTDRASKNISKTIVDIIKSNSLSICDSTLNSEEDIKIL